MPDKLVFISYSTMDAALAYQIKESLEGRGISCWMAPEAIPPGSSYLAEIPPAIRKSIVFLLVLSYKSLQSKWVAKELSMAVDEEKAVIPFHIDQSMVVDPFSLPLHDVQRIEAFNRLNAAMETLIVRINVLEEKSCARSSAENYVKISSVHINENQHFVGREALLGTIWDALRNNGKIFLRGIGGIGKSELARQVIRDHQKDYDLVIYLTFQGNLLSTLINDSPDGLCISDTKRTQDEPEEAYLTRKLNRLKELTTSNTLIVIDNYDVNGDEHFNQLASGPYQMLFTTRNEQSCGLPVIEISEMEPEEQMALFQHHYSLPLSDADKRAVAALLQTVNGHTLTIELMAKLMRRTHFKPAKMLSEISAKGLQNALSRTVDHESLTASAFSFVQYLFDTSALSEKEMYVLVNMSLMPVGGVEFFRLMDLLNLDDGEVIDDLIRKSWLRHDLAEDRLFMHPLIAEVVATQFPPSRDNVGKLLENLGKKIQFESFDLDNGEAGAYHNICYSVYLKNPDLVFTNELIWNRMCSLIARFGSFDFGIQFMKDCFTYQCKTYGEMSTQATDASNCLSWLFSTLGKTQETILYLEKAVNSIRVSNPLSENYPFYCRRLAMEYLRNPQETKKAKELLDEANKASEAIKKVDPDFEKKDNVLDGGHFAYARYYMAIKEYEKVIQEAEKSYQASIQKENNYWAHCPLKLKAYAQAHLGYRDESLKTLDEAIRFGKSCLTPDHINRVLLEKSYAELFEILGENDKALKKYKELKETFEKILYTHSGEYQDIINDIARCQEKLNAKESSTGS